ncbi:conserved hypothetical protein [Xanthomonas citri pv. fuscans]|uniref:Uncharacterized protein n=2 Tax=Xanthomonas TaxID=338 RepID=A0A7Z7NG12_XANCH|nr:conserved hypothetical protein [Xanthomonas citri pv. fuscans]SOO19923.1 conserved hypothetical protein [Xanthomonas citri pv. fuscans]SOO23263.1 conserved hypothetical protein [Xanthomonas phaseoli pv. phaseoli]SOO26336.1 conserved hypothetical protein [Xanthomonas phaseoli pv. phaseoli]SOO33959.1 hypothetical protein XFF6994_3300019 [Xanthomonas citri pv. fuscans]
MIEAKTRRFVSVTPARRPRKPSAVD